MAISFKEDAPAARSKILFAALIVASLVLIAVYVNEGSGGMLHTMQANISGVFTPAKVLSGTISGAENAASTAVGDLTADASTLSGLRDQNEELRNTISQLEEYRQEAQRLQGLLNLKDSYSLDGVSGHVMSRSSDSWNQTVTIDLGTDDGVRSGLGVMGSTGLIGQVVSAGTSTSEVRLLTDPQSGVACVIQSSRSEGIVRGSLEGLLYLEDIDDSAEVNVGDVLVTSGLGGGFSEGIMVGTVVKIDQSNGEASRKIVVMPNATVDALDEVMVITGSSSSDSSGTSSTSGGA